MAANTLNPVMGYGMTLSGAYHDTLTLVCIMRLVAGIVGHIQAHTIFSKFMLCSSLIHAEKAASIQNNISKKQIQHCIQDHKRDQLKHQPRQ